jgi:5-oxopent-3-ene-1,2,5-tricarboxylate decarboxylase/2-hydroxyhepta-2,4-diene-1,7-dioate isomerase
MKHARIAWAGAVHDAIERDGRLELLTPAFKGRLLDFDDVVWLPPLAPMPRTARAPSWRWPQLRRPREGAGLQGARRAAGLHQGRGLADRPPRFTVRPDGVQNMHYECELAVVIGKTAST